MKYGIVILLSSMVILACESKRNNQNTEIIIEKSYLFLVGTYTETPEEGFHLVKFSPRERVMERVSLVSEVENPSFVISNADRDLVFSVEEIGGKNGGKVSSFRFNKGTQSLKKINSVFTKGDHPCHISLDPSENYLVTSNYSGGNVTAIPVDQEGNLSDEIQVVQHSGKSIHPSRQQSSHVHSAVFHPVEPKIFVADLGTDKIMVYAFEKDSPMPLKPAEEVDFSVKPGAGPRHMAFNSEGNRLYIIHEITAEVGVYIYENGKLSHLDSHTLIQDSFQGKVGAAEVRLSPDGLYLYASNRGEANDLSVFQIESETGNLTPVQNISSQGIGPRNFAITPDGKFLIVGNQNSNNLVVFSRDQVTGKLDTTGLSFDIKKPVYLNFLN